MNYVDVIFMNATYIISAAAAAVEAYYVNYYSRESQLNAICITMY